MIVVADTTPLNYLFLIGQIEVLPKLYGRVIIPEAVFQELQHFSAPDSVKIWMAHTPDWLEIQKAPLQKNENVFMTLDQGEQEAILLALDLHANLLLIDERAGRQEALRRSLKVAGTLAVLEEAARRGLLDFAESIDRLKKTNFRISSEIVDSLKLRYPKMS